MAKLTIYHDTRSGKEDFPLKVRISHKKENAYITTGVRVTTEEWDSGNNMVVGHKNAMAYNTLIMSKYSHAKRVMTRLELDGVINNYSASQLKEIIEIGEIKPDSHNFQAYYISCMEKKVKDSTKSSYDQALKNLQKFDPLLAERKVEDINLDYIERLDAWFAQRGITVNSRNVYYRNIRSVLNRAIDEGIQTSYPFRKFKLRRQSTKKRALTIDELRTLRDYPCEDWQKKYVDLFFLMFYLIGINAADLLPAKKNQVRRGRLEYERAKTYKQYSIKIEPEAQALIDKYKGTDHLLSFCDEHSDYKYILQRMTKVMKTIGPYERKGRGGKKTHIPLFPDLSQYWCRHSWATIAAELDIPKETIAAALGHDMGNTTTAIYINFNQKKVDDANRRVIDFLNEK